MQMIVIYSNICKKINNTYTLHIHYQCRHSENPATENVIERQMFTNTHTQKKKEVNGKWGDT